jgi:hypothetical protein
MLAATTSLPETPGRERNYDYRYNWLRDSTFLLWGLNTLGLDREARRLFLFTQRSRRRPRRPAVMHGIGGKRELTDREREHLSGYEGARPIGSATAPEVGASTTCGGCCWTRCSYMSALVTSWTTGGGRCSPARSTPPSSTGESRITGSGRFAGRRSTSPQRRFCGGRPRRPPPHPDRRYHPPPRPTRPCRLHPRRTR